MGLRIMYQCNAPWATTGYGVQGKHLVPRLKALGHEIAYFAYYGLQGGALNLDGTPILPMGHRAWGEDILPAHMKSFKADLHISLMDVWVTEHYGNMAKQFGWTWLPWTPIDQSPVPNLVLERLEGAHTVLPYAKFGEKNLRAAGVQNVSYVPHGVDVDTFTPGDKAEARRRLGLPGDKFIVGMVAANKGYPSRKCFPEQLLAFAQFKKRHPDAMMYIHTLRTPEHGGIDFDALLKRVGLDDGSVMFADQYRYILGYPEPAMADLYRAFDFLSLTSMGEGFGIPLIEAQACGTPVVTSDNTAMTELCFGGRLVTEQYPFWTPLGAWAMIPDHRAVAEAYEQMCDALHDPEQEMQLAQAARMGALDYSWDNVVAQFWNPLLELVEADVERSRNGDL